MAKKINTNTLIDFELDKLESKVQEFQTYLTVNSLTQYKNTRIDEVEEDVQDKLHKEIVIQIKIQDALFNWLPLLSKLREAEKNKPVELRGEVEMGGMFKNKK